MVEVEVEDEVEVDAVGAANACVVGVRARRRAARAA